MFAILCFIILLSVVSNCFSQCDNGWHMFNDKCLWISHSPAARDVVKENCRTMGASPISIHSKWENNFVSSFFNPSKCDWYLTGGVKQRLGEKNIIWDDGSVHDYTGQWSSDYSHRKGFDNVVINSKTGQWFFGNKDNRYCQLCQKGKYSKIENNINQIIKLLTRNISDIQKDQRKQDKENKIIFSKLKEIENKMGNLLLKLKEQEKQTEPLNTTLNRIEEKFFEISDKIQLESFAHKKEFQKLMRDNKLMNGNLNEIKSKVHNSSLKQEKAISELEKKFKSLETENRIMNITVMNVKRRSEQLLNKYEFLENKLKLTKRFYCDKEWLLFQGKCYFVKDDKVVFNENIMICNDWNATMVSIHSTEENDFLSSITNSKRRYWIGAKLLSMNMTFTWNDNTDWDYSTWSGGQPESVIGEDCGTFFSGIWSVRNCETKFSLLCKKDALFMTSVTGY